MPARFSPQFYLASKSPRRQELLSQIGLQFSVVSVDVPELHEEGEPAESFVKRLALDKARAGWALANQPAWPVMGADTIVVVDEHILGKPTDRDDAVAMLARLSGREHQVMTAVAMVNSDKSVVILSNNKVTMRETLEAERMAYCATGEADDKAGAYAIQGQAAAFISHLDGSYSGVMGLPLYETTKLLEDFDIKVF